MAAINEHNGLLGRGYDKGINKFTAYTQTEFEALYLSKMESTAKIAEEDKSSQTSVSISVDWVAAGAVSPVKDQGSCISTYAFSAVGAIEGISVIFSKIKVEYSVQQIIDCSSSYGNHGCSTGTMYSSFNYVTAKGTPLSTQASTHGPAILSSDMSNPATPNPATTASQATPTPPRATPLTTP